MMFNDLKSLQEYSYDNDKSFLSLNNHIILNNITTVILNHPMFKKYRSKRTKSTGFLVPPVVETNSN